MKEDSGSTTTAVVCLYTEMGFFMGRGKAQISGKGVGRTDIHGREGEV